MAKKTSWRKLSISAAACQEVHAPADTVWRMLLDIEGRARFSTVSSVERLDGSKPGTPCSVGTRFRQTRCLPGEPVFSVDLMVTAKSDDGPTYPKSMALLCQGSTTSTCTLTVEPLGDSGKKSFITQSFALVAHGFYARIFLALFSRRFRDKAEYTTKMDLQDIALLFEGGQYPLDKDSAGSGKKLSCVPASLKRNAFPGIQFPDG